MKTKNRTEIEMEDFLSRAGYDILMPEVVDPAMVRSIAESLGYKQKYDSSGVGVSFVLKELDPGQETVTDVASINKFSTRTALGAAFLGQSFIYGIPTGVPPTHVDLCECNWCENKVIVELGEDVCPVCGKDGFLKEVSSDFSYASLINENAPIDEAITSILKDAPMEPTGIRYKYCVAWEITQNGTTEVEGYSMEEATDLVQHMNMAELQKHVDSEELHAYYAEESDYADTSLIDDAPTAVLITAEPLKKCNVEAYLKLNGLEEVEAKSAEDAMKIVTETIPKID